MNGLSLPFKEGRESDVCDWMGWGWGANGSLIDETTARKPHPPPDLPLEGGGVDAYGIHAIALIRHPPFAPRHIPYGILPR